MGITPISTLFGCSAKVPDIVYFHNFFHSYMAMFLC